MWFKRCIRKGGEEDKYIGALRIVVAYGVSHVDADTPHPLRQLRVPKVVLEERR